jgi:hypothetical protein
MDKGLAYVPSNYGKYYPPSIYGKAKRYIRNISKEMA